MSNKERDFTYYQERRQDMYTEARRNLAEANQTERDLCGQLILSATVLLALSGAFVASDWSGDMAGYQSVLLLVGVVALLASIGFGIAYYFKVIKTEIDWGMKDKATADIYAKLSHEQDPEELLALGVQVNLTQDSKETSTDPKLLYIEIGCLGCSAIAYVILLITLLNFK